MRKKNYFSKIVLAKSNYICQNSFVVSLQVFCRLNIYQGGAIMAKCAVCDKAVHFGNNVSHSHRRSNKMWKPNIKSVRVKVNGGTKKMPVCTGCLRSGAVERA